MWIHIINACFNWTVPNLYMEEILKKSRLSSQPMNEKFHGASLASKLGKISTVWEVKDI